MGTAPCRDALRKQSSRRKDASISVASFPREDFCQTTHLDGATYTTAQMLNEGRLVLARWLNRLSEALPENCLDEEHICLLKTHVSGARIFSEIICSRCYRHRRKGAHVGLAHDGMSSFAAIVVAPARCAFWKNSWTWKMRLQYTHLSLVQTFSDSASERRCIQRANTRHLSLSSCAEMPVAPLKGVLWKKSAWWKDAPDR